MASMIPVALLRVSSEHFVIDMCSSPGSKTDQILSMMHESAISINDDIAHGILPTSRVRKAVPAGLLVANDADPKRIRRLMSRYSRCQSCALIVTCSRAEDLQVKIGTSYFDRIVCDVPCSGDGTFRKCPHLWRLFRPRTGSHNLNLLIF